MKRGELLKALEIVKPGLANKEIIEQSTSFAFMEGRIVTYNDEISISHPVKGLNIEGAVRAEELYKLLSKLKAEEIEITTSKSEVLLKSDKTSAGLTLKKEIRLPLEEIGEQGKWKELSDDFLTAIKFCLFSCSRDMSRPVLTCINVRGDGTIESSDSLRASRYTTNKMPVKTFLLPASSAGELLKYGVSEIAEGKGWVHFRMGNGETVFSCRIFEDTFLDMDGRGIFNVEGSKLILPKEINDILDRAAVFSKREHSVDEEVTISLKDRTLIIEGRGDAGWVSEEAAVRYKGGPVTFTINPSLLKEISLHMKECVLGDLKMKFVGDGWEHVVALYERGK